MDVGFSAEVGVCGVDVSIGTKLFVKVSSHYIKV